MNKRVDTMIISDVHLGSEVSRPKEALEILRSHKFSRLILLGDIFDDLNFSRLNSEHWEFLSYIRFLSNPKRNIEVVWVIGNHDELLVEVMEHLMGPKVYDKYSWEYKGRRYFAIHGHQFDRFLINNPFLSDITTLLYKIIQKLDSKKHHFSRFIKRASKKWLRLSKEVAKGACRLGAKQKADYVFCGHTHQALSMEIDGIKYFNTGCWTDVPSNYVTIDEDGVKLLEES